MIEEFTSWDAALESLASRRLPLVLVEGAANAGKSPFAKALALPIGGLVLSTDCFIRAGGAETPYPEMVDCHAINMLAREGRRPIIIEGICLREILDPAFFEDAFTIYLKRIRDDGSWPLGEEVAKFDRSKWPLCIDVEVLDYHQRIVPHYSANAILSLQETNRPG